MRSRFVLHRAVEMLSRAAVSAVGSIASFRNRQVLEPLKAAAEAGLLAWDDTRADAAGQLIEDIVWGVRPRG